VARSRATRGLIIITARYRSGLSSCLPVLMRKKPTAGTGYAPPLARLESRMIMIFPILFKGVVVARVD
jgi:hypothetical protein